MKVFGSLSFVPGITSVALTKQHGVAAPGDYINGVSTFVSEQHDQAVNQIRKIEQDISELESDCQASIAEHNGFLAEVKADIEEFSQRHDELQALIDSSNADLLQQGNAVEAKQQTLDAAVTVAEEHADVLHADLASAQQSLEGMNEFLANAAGSHTANLVSIAEKLKEDLDGQVGSLQQQLSNIANNGDVNEQSAKSDIARLNEEIARIEQVIKQSTEDAASIHAQLANSEASLQSEQSSLSEVVQHCEDASQTQKSLLQDQMDLRDTFATIKTMLSSGGTESFLQSDSVVENVRAVRLSLQALAGQYKNAALMRVVEQMESPQWSIIFDSIAKVVDQLNQQIQEKDSENKLFVHNFSMKNEQAFDLCTNLDQAQDDLEAASLAADAAKRDSQHTQAQLRDLTQANEVYQSEIESKIKQNGADLEAFQQNHGSLGDLITLVQDRIAKKNLVESLQVKVQEARQGIAASIENLKAENKDLSDLATGAQFDFEATSQDLESKVSDFDAHAKNAMQMARQSDDKIHLLEKEQATIFGELRNFGESEKACTSVDAACVDARDSCGASSQAIQDANIARIAEMKTELAGVLDARDALKQIVA